MQESPYVVARKKLIEVALPLDAISEASAREKSIRHGHPSTLHLWWSRKPLAASRAVIFAQMVDDPSASPDLFPTQSAQSRERKRLFRIVEDLVKWENTSNEEVLQRARDEIWQSWRRTCAENTDHPRAKALFDRHVLPTFHDPFAGGGSLPLEAQRLGLEAHASDLNPVAVLINKAMIEIPPKFASCSPINPDAREDNRLIHGTWDRARGLAEDVRYYGYWIRKEAKKRIGHLYPKVHVTSKMTRNRPDLKPYIGHDLTVISWLWVRTVKSPNPAFGNVMVPLAPTFVLSRKRGKESYIEPVIDNGDYRFTVKVGSPPRSASKGTKIAHGANFRCLLSGVPITGQYIKSESQCGRMGVRLKAIVAQGNGERVYLEAASEHEALLATAIPKWRPNIEIHGSTQYIGVRAYGMDHFSDLFTNRQLTALTTLSELIPQATKKAKLDCLAANMPNDGDHLRDGGTGATAYAEAIGVYLALGLSRLTDICNALCRWEVSKTQVRNLFGRQAIPMMWDYAENNIFAKAAGDYAVSLSNLVKALAAMPASREGTADQADAQYSLLSENVVTSIDPPYYDNVPYADLSDFFYVWLRRPLINTYPELFSTLAAPKNEELVVATHRHDNRKLAQSFFLEGMTQVMKSLGQLQASTFPITIYFAFKQSDLSSADGPSTAWETFLNAIGQANLMITGAWPLRTELRNRLRGLASNALASSVVLVCRPRSASAVTATRREFRDVLRNQLPVALARLQEANIAPVDVAQASIGPGMAAFGRFRQVINADGTAMSVRDALGLINATLDEVLAEQEWDLDSDTRWAVTWMEQFGFADGDFGVAEQLSKAKNTSVEGLVQAGIIESRRGNVRLLEPAELAPTWDPSADSRLTVWEMTHHLIRTLESGGEPAAADLASDLASQAEAARDLAYRLYTVSERRRRAADALRYNSLVQSWPEITRLARQRPKLRQTEMLRQVEEGP